MQGELSSKGDMVERILGVLRDVHGYFVLRDEAGEEYVIIRRQDFDGAGRAEVQLSLPEQPSREIASLEDYPSADTVLERINREIADYHWQQNEDEIEEMEQDVHKEEPPPAAEAPLPPPRFKAPVEPPRRVRFEPLRGDLPPELQED